MKFTTGEDGSVYPDGYDSRPIYNESSDEILERIRTNVEEQIKINRDKDVRILQLKMERPDLYNMRLSYIQKEDYKRKK